MTNSVSARRAVYPGSFDPIHLGHVDIVQRISGLFDEVIVLIAASPDKAALFGVEERKELLRQALAAFPNVRIEAYDGLTVEFMRAQKAGVIVRGLRAVIDFENEMSMASMNRKLAPEIETLVVFSSPEHNYISSRRVKEVAHHKGSLVGLVPPLVQVAIEKRRPS